MRKGVYQYTHTESNCKTDAIKDKEDEAINMNFIMPEERVKQKEQMLVNVNDETFKLTEVNKHEFDGFKTLTSSAKEDVIKLKDTLYSFLGHAQREKDNINEELFGRYMEKYGISQKAEQRLKELKEKYDRAKQKEQQRLEL